MDELKSRLRITWEEEDENLKNILEDSYSYFKYLTNSDYDLEEDTWVRRLILERCRYDYHNVLDEFEDNYKHELKRLILLVALGHVGVVKNEEG